MEQGENAAEEEDGGALGKREDSNRGRGVSVLVSRGLSMWSGPRRHSGESPCGGAPEGIARKAHVVGILEGIAGKCPCGGHPIG